MHFSSPHLAVKAHPDPAVISLLLHLGAGVDCASKVSDIYIIYLQTLWEVNIRH